MNFLVQTTDYALAAEYGQFVERAFARWEQILSRFRPDSELNQLHQHPGHWQPCSPILWDVLMLARWAWEWSDGLIDPTIRTALEQTGYHASFDEVSHTTPPTTTSPATIHWQDVEWDFNAHQIKIPAHIKLDLAGVAKSWAAQQAIALFPELSVVALDAAGDIAVRGTPSDYPAWPIEIEPLAGFRTSGVLALDEAHGIATSGIDQRRWQHHGVSAHHIIDPRTGHPSTSDIIRASVIAPTIVQADVAARLCVILGSQQALEWIDRHPQMALFAHRHDGQTITSPHWDAFTWDTFTQIN